MEHLAEQSVLDFVTGALVEPLATAVHEHLDQCDECRAVVAQVLRPAVAGSPGDSGSRLVEQARASGAADTLPALGEGSEPPTAAEGPAAIRGAQPVPIDHIDEYRLVELVGSGGMGTVYRARDTLLDRDVAIKLMARTGSEVARQRFLGEARAVARIRHPNVVVVHRVGIAGDRPYIIYDLVRGRTFAELAPPRPWPKVLELAVGMARGLAAAHGCGVLHRDLKPANVMLDDHDEVVVVDFGLAKLDTLAALDGALEAGANAPSASPLDDRMTATGIALGTPRYMAPESWRGASATPQTDLYSFGLILYELLSGRLPFTADDADALSRAVCEQDPPPLTEIAPWVAPVFASIVDRCVARDLATRPSSAAALADELEALQLGRAFDAIERERVRRVPRGNPYVAGRPFGFEHQGVFFGRATELRSLVEQVRARPLLVVAGEAGVGKTSLCTAGLLPIILQGGLGGSRRWVPVSLVAGERPLAALAEVLAPHVEHDASDVLRLMNEDPDRFVAAVRAGHGSGCSGHVLFIDQLEDLVTSAPRDQAERFAAIIGKLAEPSPSVRVVATVRAGDMLAVAQLPGLAAVIGPALYLVLEPRDRGALREIVVEPARLGGRVVGDDIVETLVTAASRGELRIGDLGTRLASMWDAFPAAR